MNKDKNDLSKFAGILTWEEGEKMIKDLEEIKEMNIRIMKKKFKDNLL